jgi:type IV pilus assembly protein PilO
MLPNRRSEGDTVKLAPRDKLIALAVGVVLVIVILVVVLVVPQFGKLRSVGADIETANAESSEARTLLDQRLTIKNQAADTGAALLRLANAVPENPELPSLIIELQDAAYASGVSLRSVTPQDPIQVAGDSFVSVGLGLEVWGTWADTVDFLGRLRHKLGRAVRIQQFDSSVLTEMEASEAKIELPPYYQVKTSINIFSYVIPEGSVSASTSATPTASAPAPTSGEAAPAGSEPAPAE